MTGMLARGWMSWRRRNWRPEAATSDFATLKPVVLITGGSEGIGLALAQRFAEAGNSLCLVAREADKLAAAATEITRGYGVSVDWIAQDLTELAAAQRLARAVAARGGYVDVLVNNAGIGLSGPLTRHTADELARVCDLNMRAATLLMRQFLPGMLARGHGGVLNIGSLGGLAPGPNQAAYYASKAYLLSLTEAVAAETRGLGVSVSVVVPGPVATDFHRRMGAERSAYLWLLPVMKPAQIARSAYFWFRLGRVLIIPGVLHHVSVVALRFMPHSVILPILGWMLRRPI